MNSRNSESNVCLVIIYNHNYERNIPHLERLYLGKFSNIYHLVPFYTGSAPNVIGVYDSSHQFNNYITQAHDRLTKGLYTHFVFVADDMILRRDLDENNIIERLGLEPDSAFIPFYQIIDNSNFFTWPWALKQVGKLNYPTKACEFRKFLPDIHAARKLLEKHGIPWQKGYTKSVLPFALRGCISPHPGELIKSYLHSARFRFLYKIHRALASIGLGRRGFSFADYAAQFAKRIDKRGETPEYPLLWAYADFFVIPASRFDSFCHVSGLLASGRVMVEAAIPTALVFSMERIVQSKDIGASNGLMNGSPDEFFRFHGGSLASVISQWEPDVLFYHPIKLSQWKLDLPELQQQTDLP